MRRVREEKQELGQVISEQRIAMDLSASHLRNLVGVNGKKAAGNLIRNIENGESAYTVDKLLMVLDILGGRLHVTFDK